MKDITHKMRRQPVLPKREDAHRNIIKNLRVIGWDNSEGDGHAYCSACDVHLKLTARKNRSQAT